MKMLFRIANMLRCIPSSLYPKNTGTPRGLREPASGVGSPTGGGLGMERLDHMKSTCAGKAYDQETPLPGSISSSLPKIGPNVILNKNQKEKPLD